MFIFDFFNVFYNLIDRIQSIWTGRVIASLNGLNRRQAKRVRYCQCALNITMYTWLRWQSWTVCEAVKGRFVAVYARVNASP